MGNRHASGQAQGLAGYADWTAARAHRTGKASIRAKVEHPFRIIKNLFGMKKVSWRRTQRGCTRSLGWRIY
jgi:hypothetical protein